jgi:hypothetical protein
MLANLRPAHYHFIKDDPVRPHIALEWRQQFPREMFALYEDKYAEFDEPLTDNPLAIICVAYTDTVPISEADLNNIGSKVAVFYTVWSYATGAGRDVVMQAAKYIKQHRQCERYVTLSPLTAMAERFHLKNGAQFISRHAETQNFEYHL